MRGKIKGSPRSEWEFEVHETTNRQRGLCRPVVGKTPSIALRHHDAVAPSYVAAAEKSIRKAVVAADLRRIREDSMGARGNANLIYDEDGDVTELDECNASNARDGSDVVNLSYTTEVEEGRDKDIVAGRAAEDTQFVVI
ncbi:predicted protein [Postia placenta Mad-698-R]|uniref:Uncharacterized protein n=1 Tax=Postia placenta MAD-698-R-SB12 TaxID=670580 RepID=A0A1X6NBT9_9APHY|nr:hypothetical protein POSPLADRAFT_1043517 [Postia placenta MAD-698-R-SB12]EED81566.1 predicted protein [Postia placenta Mad-698-R]OSX65972.1 hypothetical protein POSPLADRAFT_1043517 [Postia placenta MAD-698-R-SB12]